MSKRTNDAIYAYKHNSFFDKIIIKNRLKILELIAIFLARSSDDNNIQMPENNDWLIKIEMRGSLCNSMLNRN